MDPNPGASGWGEGPSSTPSSGHGHGPGPPSSAVSSITVPTTSSDVPQPPPATQQHQRPPLSRYESQKRRDWNTFLQYLKNHKPPLSLARCSGAHVIEFLKYLDQFGKTKVHTSGCLFFGQPNPPSPCGCPLRQAWGSLDALVGRLRAAYEENGGKPESNPFGARAVRIFLREIRQSQAKARGIAYEKKRRKRIPRGASSSSASAGVGTAESSSPGTVPAGTEEGTVGGERSGAPPPVPPHP